MLRFALATVAGVILGIMGLGFACGYNMGRNAQKPALSTGLSAGF